LPIDKIGPTELNGGCKVLFLIGRKRPMKRYLRIIVISSLLISVPILIFADNYMYVSSTYSIYYHRPTCKKVLKINPHTRVTFKTAKEALDAGKRPCPICKPPTKDQVEKEKVQEF
jgi:hypothetical protein